MSYDSRADTINHISVVRNFINRIETELILRAMRHDQSKLESPEKEIFDKYTPLLKESTYGSEEYNERLKEMDKALTHHYAHNRHHPEHFENGINDMNLIDILEMLCDWKAATLRHDNGDILKSIEINSNRFGISDQLKEILINSLELIT